MLLFHYLPQGFVHWSAHSAFGVCTWCHNLSVSLQYLDVCIPQEICAISRTFLLILILVLMFLHIFSPPFDLYSVILLQQTFRKWRHSFPEPNKCLRFAVWTNLRYSFHVLNFLNRMRRLSIRILRLKQFSLEQTIIASFLCHCILAVWIYCSLVIFPGLLRKDFLLALLGAVSFSLVVFLLFRFTLLLICDLHLRVCKHFPVKINVDPIQSFFNDLSFCVDMRPPLQSTDYRWRRLRSIHKFPMLLTLRL